MMNKFHDKKSLCAGVVAGGLVATIGIVLSLHCIDMIRYYKKHRIVRIIKTDTERFVHK